MADDTNNHKTEELHMSFSKDETSILSQIAKLLVSEKLINTEEQLRFLALLKEES